MNEASGDRSKLVIATANRLRMVQADLADESPETRQQYLADEVERGMSQVVPAERAEFLNELRGLFPTWEQPVHDDGSKDGMEGSPTDLRELNDASFLVDRLIKLAPTLSAADQQAIAAKLREAGLSAEGRQVWPEQAAEKLRAHLKLPDDASIDPTRAVELLQMLHEMVTSLDQLVWSTWKAVSPRSEIRGAGELKKAVPAFISGDPDLSRADVLHQVEKLRQLTAAMVSAISQTGYQFAQQHYARFAPQHIEDWAKKEKGAFESAAVACWRKYKELVGTSDQTTIEREIMQLIADYAERLMKGLKA